MRHEDERQPELAPELLQAFTAAFINRFDCYPIQNSDGSYSRIQQPLTLPIVEQHIRGRFTIGAYALDERSRAKFLVLDADDDDDWTKLLTLAHDFEEQGLPVYREASSRGGHLWMFAHAMPGKDIRRFGKWLLTKYELEGMEIYPRQDELRTGVGSLIRLPLGYHRKLDPPKRFGFIDASGQPLAPTIREQLAILSKPKRLPRAYIKEALSHIPEPKPVSPTPQFTKRGEIMGDTPSEKIKNAVSVAEFVSQYVDLDRNGRGLCPFHDDHRMSLAVHPERNFWHCFAGCEGQTVIDFYMKWHGVDFKTAVKDLAKQLLPPLP
jgi:hypothetical protein